MFFLFAILLTITLLTVLTYTQLNPREIAEGKLLYDCYKRYELARVLYNLDMSWKTWAALHGYTLGEQEDDKQTTV